MNKLITLVGYLFIYFQLIPLIGYLFIVITLHFCVLHNCKHNFLKGNSLSKNDWFLIYSTMSYYVYVCYCSNVLL